MWQESKMKTYHGVPIALCHVFSKFSPFPASQHYIQAHLNHDHIIIQIPHESFHSTNIPILKSVVVAVKNGLGFKRGFCGMLWLHCGWLGLNSGMERVNILQYLYGWLESESFVLDPFCSLHYGAKWIYLLLPCLSLLTIICVHLE